MPPSQTDTTRRRGRLKLGLKIAVTLVLMGVAFTAVEPGAVASVTAGVRWSWVAVAGLTIIAIVVLDAIQFRAVALAFGHVIAPATSIRMAFVGRFFALFTPAMVGNDIYRAAAMHGIGFGAGSAVSTVLVSRFVSLVALVPVLVAGLPVIAWLTGGAPETAVFALVGLVSVVAVAALYLMARLGPRIARVSSRPVVSRALALASGVTEALLGSPARRQIWASAILQHLLRVLAFAALGRAYGLEQGIAVFFAFVPVSLLIAMVPVSLGSWGLRELSFVYSLGFAGVPAAEALAVSVSFGLLGLLFGISGGALWLFKPDRNYVILPRSGAAGEANGRDDRFP